MSFNKPTGCRRALNFIQIDCELCEKMCAENFDSHSTLTLDEDQGHSNWNQLKSSVQCKSLSSYEVLEHPVCKCTGESKGAKSPPPTTTLSLSLSHSHTHTHVMLCVSQTIHDQSASLNTACVLQRLLLSRNHTVFNITDQHAGPLRTTHSVLN